MHTPLVSSGPLNDTITDLKMRVLHVFVLEIFHTFCLVGRYSYAPANVTPKIEIHIEIVSHAVCQ